MILTVPLPLIKSREVLGSPLVLLKNNVAPLFISIAASSLLSDLLIVASQLNTAVSAVVGAPSVQFVLFDQSVDVPPTQIVRTGSVISAESVAVTIPVVAS